MLENPQYLRQLVKDSNEVNKTVNTDYQYPESVDHLCDKCETYAANGEPMEDEIWSSSHPDFSSFSSKCKNNIKWKAFE